MGDGGCKILKVIILCVSNAGQHPPSLVQPVIGMTLSPDMVYMTTMEWKGSDDHPSARISRTFVQGLL